MWHVEEFGGGGGGGVECAALTELYKTQNLQTTNDQRPTNEQSSLGLAVNKSCTARFGGRWGKGMGGGGGVGVI